MSTTEQFGFTFQRVNGTDPIVIAFFRAHLVRNGFPLDMVPVADHWIAVIRKEGVYAVFGWRADPTQEHTVIVTDMYAYPSRWGVLATYAALEKLKTDCDAAGMDAITITPFKNERMQAAYKRILHLTEPTHVVYKYNAIVEAKEGAA